ncbi:MAG TPA: M28 family peptidase [Thermoleophilaceae bacterium]|nr:M28 family peptidase [Thermoleophilaceae bacterium]
MNATRGQATCCSAREVIETLAPLERRACSDGERQAAEWIAERLRRAGCEVAIEEEDARGLYMPTLAGLGVAGIAAALLTIAGRRVLGALVSLLGAAALVDEAQNGPRLLRRALLPRRTTVNVVARSGPDDAARTLVVLAHHDAHQTGRLYDQALLMAVHRRAPWLIARMRTSLPQWWVGLAGPALTLLAAATGRRRPAVAALPVLAVGTAAAGEVARNPVSPGANDNLSGVAALVTVAELLAERPLPHTRVMLVSCGAEEALQEGIRGFVARHDLDPSSTSFLNLETVGSPRLIMLEGEGPIWMEDYSDPGFRDLVERCARDAGVELERGFRARASTDSVIPSRAGHPTATITSITPWGALANYHLVTDLPENVDHGSVERAARLAYGVAAAIG